MSARKREGGLHLSFRAFLGIGAEIINVRATHSICANKKASAMLWFLNCKKSCDPRHYPSVLKDSVFPTGPGHGESPQCPPLNDCR